MLQTIRDRTQGLVAGIIVSLLILSFALWGIHSYLVGGSSNNFVATVNGIEISNSQFSSTYERLRRQFQMQYNAMPDAQVNLKQRTLQDMINLEVLKQASVSEGYKISSGQIDEVLRSIPAFQVNGEFSLAQFQRALSSMLYTAPELINLINTKLLIDQPRLGLLFSSFALPNEVTLTNQLIEQEREIHYAILPKSSLTQPVVISDKEIEKYYTNNKEQFKTPEQVSLDYVQLSIQDIASTIHLADEALRKFYNENTSNFSTPAKWKYSQILIPLSGNSTEKEISDADKKLAVISQAAKTGKDFNALAKENGLQVIQQDWQDLTKLPNSIQQVLPKLTKVGQVSAPIKSEKGMTLIKITAYQGPQVSSFEQAKAKVATALSLQQAEEKFADLREKLANLSYEHPETLGLVAKQLNLPVKSTGVFSKSKGSEGLSQQAKIREAAFSNEVLTLRNNSDVIQLGPDTAVVIRVKSHVPASVLALSDVRQQIVDKLSALETQKRLAIVAEDIKAKLLSGNATPEQVAQQFQIKWVSLGSVGRHAEKVDSAILDAAFKMPEPKNAKTVYTVTAIPDGFAIIGLSSVKNGSIPKDQQQYQIFAEQVQSSQGLLEYELYKNSLVARAKIEVVAT